MSLDGIYDNTDNKSREFYQNGELMAFCVRSLFPQECLKTSSTKFPFPLFDFGHFPDVNNKGDDQ